MVLTKMVDSKIAITKNLILYGLFVLIAFLGIVYGNWIKQDYSNLRLWDYNNLFILLLGAPFLFFQHSVGLPNFLDEAVSTQKRFFQPLLIGSFFGLLDVLIIKCIMHPEPYSELPPFLQPFPYSLFLYFSGAFEIELFYRLIPLTVILSLGKWLKNGKYMPIFLWSAILLTSLREPLEQIPSGASWYIFYALTSGFLMNYFQAIYFKNAGFLASFTIRLSHYLFWHILLGMYVQFVEL